MSSRNTKPAKRVCQIIKLKPERVDEYKQIHAAVWPGVLAALKKAHITDYSINHYPPLQLLIATFKYTGDDYAGDMAKVAKDPETRRWWALTDGMQESFVEGATGSGKDIPWWQNAMLTKALTYRKSKRHLDSKDELKLSSTIQGLYFGEDSMELSLGVYKGSRSNLPSCCEGVTAL